MVKEQKRIFRIVYKQRNATKERVKRLPRGTTLLQAQRARAKMGADPKNEYAELREEWK